MSVFKNDRLIRVLNHLPVDRIPVWMMRQAGRTDPEYNQLRKNDGRALEELFADPEIAIKISLLPNVWGWMQSSCFRIFSRHSPQWEQVSILIRVRFWKNLSGLWLR